MTAVLGTFFVAGCGLLAGAIGPPADDLSDWSRVPLPPDAELTAQAQQTCGGDPDAPLPFLLQDRRTPWTAVVLFGDDDEYSMCTVSHRGGAGFGAGGADIGGHVAPGADLTIRGGEGALRGNDVVVVDGTVAVPAARITVQREDGVVVEASTGGGRWLAWWPGGAAAVRAVAYDAGGNPIARAGDGH